MLEPWREARASPQDGGVAEAARKARLDALLDEALSATFPASDPVAVSLSDMSARAVGANAKPAAR